MRTNAPPGNNTGSKKTNHPPTEAGLLFKGDIVKAIDWRGNQVDPTALLAKYGMTIEHGPATGYHVVEVRETSGRPELRNIVLGTREPVAFDWLNIGKTGLKSEMKRDMATGIEENTLNLNVNAGSYYWPGQSGPHHVKASGPSDTVHGWGLAQNVPDQPPDNRYLTLIVVWQYGTEATESPAPDPEPPIDPDPPIAITRITIEIPEHMAGTYQGLARQAVELARRAS